MSAGHGHSRPNLRHPKEIDKLRREGGFDEMMKRWQELDVDHDMVDLGGYNVDGTTRYIDKDIFRALLDPDYAKEIGVGEIDTGLTPEETVTCLLEHEGTEKALIDSDNDIDDYISAHEYATVAEHEKVRAFGGSPIKYERGLAKAIKWCQKKTPEQVPADFACAPLLDDPDANDKRVLKLLREQGVADAFKTSKASVDYSKATGEDQCARCSHWAEDREADLSRCEIVSGLVRKDRWCTKFEVWDDRQPTEPAA